MNSKKLFSLAYDFLLCFVIFVLLSEVAKGEMELASNVCWAIGLTVFFAIRSELKSETKRIFDMVFYGAGVVFMPIALFMSNNTRFDYAAEIIVFIYSAYRFCEAFFATGKEYR
jgi:hypothetical protein